EDLGLGPSGTSLEGSYPPGIRKFQNGQAVVGSRVLGLGKRAWAAAGPGGPPSVGGRRGGAKEGGKDYRRTAQLKPRQRVVWSVSRPPPAPERLPQRLELV